MEALGQRDWTKRPQFPPRSQLQKDDYKVISNGISLHLKLTDANGKTILKLRMIYGLKWVQFEEEKKEYKVIYADRTAEVTTSSLILCRYPANAATL